MECDTWLPRLESPFLRRVLPSSIAKPDRFHRFYASIARQIRERTPAGQYLREPRRFFSPIGDSSTEIVRVADSIQGGMLE